MRLKAAVNQTSHVTWGMNNMLQWGCGENKFAATSFLTTHKLILTKMAAINDDVYARVREKIKEHNLTEQEVKAIDTARDQLQTHSKQLTEWQDELQPGVITNMACSLHGWVDRRNGSIPLGQEQKVQPYSNAGTHRRWLSDGLTNGPDIGRTGRCQNHQYATKSSAPHQRRPRSTASI